MLDFGFRQHSQPLTILNDMFASAVQADKLRFSHYWLAEHHGSPNYAWANPEPLLPLVAAMTSKINIGIAGQLIKYYSPYQVASTYKMLATLFPGRIDLGLASGGVEKQLDFHFNVPRTLDTTNTNEYKSMLKEILAYLHNDQSGDAALKIKPETSLFPNLWRLSKTFSGLEEAAALKLNYCVSAFHQAIDTNEAKIALEQFNEKQEKPGFTPQINICFAGICHANGAKPDSATPYIVKNCLTGDINFFQETIYRYVETLGVTEFTFLDLNGDSKKRRKTLDLLAGLL